MIKKLAQILSLKNLINTNFMNKKDVHVLSDIERNALQKCLLDIYKDVNAVCRKYELCLFAQGGTLLGTVRHGGYIPWDDDVDLGMIRKDYQKLIDVFDKELGEKYLLRAPNSKHPPCGRFMQIYKKRTFCKGVGSRNPNAPLCANIDIFPLDFAPNNILIQRLKGISSNLLMIIASCVETKTYHKGLRDILMNNFIGQVYYFLRQIIGVVFSFKSPEQWFNIVDNYIASSKNTSFITSATGRKHYLGELLKFDTIFPLRTMFFEDIPIYVPNRPEIYLRNLYGETSYEKSSIK